MLNLTCPYLRHEDEDCHYNQYGLNGKNPEDPSRLSFKYRYKPVNSNSKPEDHTPPQLKGALAGHMGMLPSPSAPVPAKSPTPSTNWLLARISYCGPKGN